MRTLRNYPRLLGITMLACAVTVSACINEGCNLTGPSEATGSHQDEKSVTLVVLVEFFDRNERFSSATVTVGSSTTVVERSGFATVVVDGVQKGSRVFISVANGISTSCTWNGNRKIFAADASVVLFTRDPILNENGSVTPAQIVASCGGGWR